MIKESELNALLSLLDDADQEVYEHVFDRLLSYGPGIIPSLEDAWSGSYNDTLHKRIEDLIHKIQYESLIKDWQHWVEEGEFDLLTGCYLLSRYRYPELKLEDMRRDIERIKKDIWLELSYNLTPFEQVNVFNQIFFGNFGFTGNATAEQFPKEYYLSHLLDTKSGNSMSLGLLYMIIAQDLDLPIYGVTLPRHFVMVYCKRHLKPEEDIEARRNMVMFYVNPLNKGSIFTRNEITEYLEKLKLDPKDEYFTPAQNKRVLKECLLQMKQLLESNNAQDHADEISYLLSLMD